MSLTINTNELSLSAQRHLAETQTRLDKTFQQLASGSKITRSSDDAAGLAISEGLRADIRSLGTALQNAHDGISMVQVFEGGTSSINELIMRTRELAMRSASDTMGERERAIINNEVIQLKEEMERIAQTAEFGGSRLLDGSTVEMAFQVGVGNVDEIDRITFSPGDSDLTVDALGLEDVDVSDRDGAHDALDAIDEALYRVNEVRARVGAVQSRLQTTVQAARVFRENLSATNSRIRDTNMADATAQLAKETILREAGVAILGQANQTPSIAIQLLRG